MIQSTTSHNVTVVDKPAPEKTEHKLSTDKSALLDTQEPECSSYDSLAPEPFETEEFDELTTSGLYQVTDDVEIPEHLQWGEGRVGEQITLGSTNRTWLTDYCEQRENEAATRNNRTAQREGGSNQGFMI